MPQAVGVFTEGEKSIINAKRALIQSGKVFDMQKVNWSERYEWFNKQDEKDGRLMALLRYELTYEEVIRLYKKGFYLKSKDGDVSLRKNDIRRMFGVEERQGGKS
ncbi:hypothetical protein [Bacillus velezensis]|uniref:hypothetical protein n=2 Tax=Bacillus subtilis group TaxID=653685 RepID=UPI00299F763D|nr:hypothetical protein [Bacillus velezensis]